MKPFLIALAIMALFMEFVGVASRVMMVSKVVRAWPEQSCLSQFLRSCVLAGSHLPERVLMLFVLTVISWVTPSVTVTRILNAASLRRMVIMPLIVACPGGVALPCLTLAFLLLIHTLRLIFRTLLLMCLLLILHLLLMFLNALCLFPRLSLCLILSSHRPSDVPPSCPPSVPPFAVIVIVVIVVFVLFWCVCSSGFSIAVFCAFYVVYSRFLSAVYKSFAAFKVPISLRVSRALLRAPSPSSVITGTPTVSDLQLAAEPLSQSLMVSSLLWKFLKLVLLFRLLRLSLLFVILFHVCRLSVSLLSWTLLMVLLQASRQHPYRLALAERLIPLILHEFSIFFLKL